MSNDGKYYAIGVPISQNTLLIESGYQVVEDDIDGSFDAAVYFNDLSSNNLSASGAVINDFLSKCFTNIKTKISPINTNGTIGVPVEITFKLSVGDVGLEYIATRNTPVPYILSSITGATISGDYLVDMSFVEEMFRGTFTDRTLSDPACKKFIDDLKSPKFLALTSELEPKSHITLWIIFAIVLLILMMRKRRR